MAPSGLQPSPFDSVTPSSTVVMVPSGSRRYSAPPPGRASWATVPAQNLPAGSHTPSLKRTSSGMPAGRHGPASLAPSGPARGVRPAVRGAGPGRGRRSGGSYWYPSGCGPLFAHPQGEAPDQIPLEDEVDDEGGSRADERAGHQHRDARGPARRQRGQPDRDRPLLRVLQEQQPDQEIVPDLDELEHGHGGDGRPGQGHRDPQEGPDVPEPVHDGGLDQVVGDPPVVRGHQERREGYPERDVDQDGAEVGVDEAELPEVDVLGDDDRLQRDHERGDDAEEDDAAGPVAELGEREPGAGGDDQDEREGGHADDGRVGQFPPDRQLGEELPPAHRGMPVLLLELRLGAGRVVEHVIERVEHHHRDHGHQREERGRPQPPAGRRGGGAAWRRLGRCHRYHPSPSSDLISRSWTRPTVIMMTNRMMPYRAPVPNWPWENADW